MSEKKARWIGVTGYGTEQVYLTEPKDNPSLREYYLVREVLDAHEISEEEINKFADDFENKRHKEEDAMDYYGVKESFITGATWAIQRMKGEE